MGIPYLAQYKFGTQYKYVIVTQTTEQITIEGIYTEKLSMGIKRLAKSKITTWYICNLRFINYSYNIILLNSHLLTKSETHGLIFKVTTVCKNEFGHEITLKDY